MEPHPSHTEIAKPRRELTIAAAMFLVVACALLFMPLSRDYRASWYSATLDWLHLPVFAAMCLATCQVLQGRRWYALGIIVGLATLTEFVQPFVGRSASIVDWTNGMLGVGCAACWMFGRNRPLIRWGGPLVLAAWPTIVTWPYVSDAWHAWRAFPVLSDFQSPFELRRWYVSGAKIVPQASGGAIIDFEPSTQGSGAILFPAVRDWSHCRQLICDFEFDGEPLTFLISVRDGKKLPPELPRFDLWQRYTPGKHHVVIDLDELRRGGRFPPIDLERIQSFHLVAYDDHPRSVYFHTAYLLPQP